LVIAAGKLSDRFRVQGAKFRVQGSTYVVIATYVKKWHDCQARNLLIENYKGSFLLL
jgi:hypothetical protein